MRLRLRVQLLVHSTAGVSRAQLNWGANRPSHLVPPLPPCPPLCRDPKSGKELCGFTNRMGANAPAPRLLRLKTGALLVGGRA